MRVLRLGGCLCLCLTAASRGDMFSGGTSLDADPVGVTIFSLARFARGQSDPQARLAAPDADTKAPRPSSQNASPAVAAPGPRRPWRAAGLVLGLNLGVWAYDYHGLDEDYAYVNPGTIRHNISRWDLWDADGFKTNFFAHPYHGSVYFNSARANGLGFWSSALYTAGGSLMWEIFLERLRPTFTDFMNTTMGGVFLGEVVYRFSSLVLDDTAGGFERVWREAVGMVINPVRGFNRLLDGDMKAKGSSPGRSRAPFSGVVMFSDGAVSQGVSLSYYKTSPMLSFSCEYGDAHTDDASRQPFDYFAFDGTTRYTNRLLYFSVYANGLFLGRNLVSRDDHDLVIGLFQDFDFLNNEAVYLGGSSVCGGLRSSLRLSRTSRLTTTMAAGWMLVGASSNEYFQVDGEDYNFGTGLTAKLGTLADFSRFGSILLRWTLSEIHGLSGIKVTDGLNVFRGRYMLPVWKGLGMGIEYTLYRRNSELDGQASIRKRLYEIRTSVAYGF